MRAFEIYLNGKKLCTAAVGNEGVLTAIVSSVRRQLRSARQRAHARSREDLVLDVGGLVTSTAEHVRWKTPRLRNGDEVRVRVVDIELADEPDIKQRTDATARAKRQERYLEVTARKRGWKILKPKSGKTRG